MGLRVYSRKFATGFRDVQGCGGFIGGLGVEELRGLGMFRDAGFVILCDCACTLPRLNFVILQEPESKFRVQFALGLPGASILG